MSAAEGIVSVEFIMSPGNRVQWTMPPAQWATVSALISLGTGFVSIGEGDVIHTLAVPHIACFKVTQIPGAEVAR